MNNPCTLNLANLASFVSGTDVTSAIAANCFQHTCSSNPDEWRSCQCCCHNTALLLAVLPKYMSWEDAWLVGALANAPPRVVSYFKANFVKKT